MPHAITQPMPPITLPGGAELHAVPAWQDNVSWLLVCTQSGEAAVIDGPEADPVLGYCARTGLRLTTILTTHVHGDHIGIHRDLQARGVLGRLRVVGAAATAARVPGLTEPVAEGAEVELGALRGTVWLTEGHINGHVSYVFDGAVFCGDTMFAGGCGYLFDGPPAKMHASLQRLAALPADTRVCCAHEYTLDNLRFAWTVEPDNAALEQRLREATATRARGGATIPSTVGDERATNPFVRTDSPTLRDRVATALDRPALRTTDDHVAVFAATRALKDRKDHRALPDEAFPA